MGRLNRRLSYRIEVPRCGRPARLRRRAVILMAVLILCGCGRPAFDSDVTELILPSDGRFEVEPNLTYSVAFDCLIALPRNSTSIANELVSLDEVDLLRNPRNTVSSGILTAVENARVVSREFETWIWIDSLDEVEIDSPDWPQERVRNSTKRELYWAMRKNPRNGPSRPDGPIRANYFRAGALEYRLVGSIKFKIPSGLSLDIARTTGLSREGSGFSLPFVFASKDLGGEGVGFVIDGKTGSDRYSVRVSQGSYCDRFKDRNIWR